MAFYCWYSIIFCVSYIQLSSSKEQYENHTILLLQTTTSIWLFKLPNIKTYTRKKICEQQNEHKEVYSVSFGIRVEPARTELLGKMKHEHQKCLVRPREARKPCKHTHAVPSTELYTLSFFCITIKWTQA